VSGEPGAIRTSGDEPVVAKVTNRSNDATGSAAVNDDGSFEVRVEGTLEDDYELTVTARGTSDSTTETLAASSGASATCLERTGMAPNEGSTTGPQPICGALYAEASCRATELAATVSLDCEANEDCVIAYSYPDCNDSVCFSDPLAVSTQGALELAAGRASINETTCQAFDNEGCSYSYAGCTPPPQLAAVCEDGQCVGRAVQWGFECTGAVLVEEAATCEDFEAEALCRRDQMLAGLPNACSEDEDCEIVYAQPACAENDCSGNFVIAASSADDVESGMAAIDDGICGLAAEMACGYPGAPCNSVAPTPRCIAGECVAEIAQ
jgi:hypothetical protein